MSNRIQTEGFAQHDNRVIIGQPSEAHVRTPHIKAAPYSSVINYHGKAAQMQQHHNHHQYQHLHCQHLITRHHPSPVQQLRHSEQHCGVINAGAGTSTCDNNEFPLPLIKPRPRSSHTTTVAMLTPPSEESPPMDSSAVASVESGEKSAFGVPMATQTESEMVTDNGSTGLDRLWIPEQFRVHFDKIGALHNKLRTEVDEEKQLIKRLRIENARKSKEIDQIKDLNIKLQLELEKYRSSDANTAGREVKVTFPDGITLTAYNLKDLECCEIGEKGDSAFILKMLLALYTRDELRMKSITGKPSRNKKYVQDTAEKFSPKKLQFIKEKFRERVIRENTMPTEREKRCRDERVHKIINTKIQNLKRKKVAL